MFDPSERLGAAREERRSVPASTAVEAAPAKHKNDKNDDENGGEVHVGAPVGTRTVSDADGTLRYTDGYSNAENVRGHAQFQREEIKIRPSADGFGSELAVDSNSSRSFLSIRRRLAPRA